LIVLASFSPCASLKRTGVLWKPELGIDSDAGTCHLSFRAIVAASRLYTDVAEVFGVPAVT